jgi:hypothetical protein
VNLFSPDVILLLRKRFFDEAHIQNSASQRYKQHNQANKQTKQANKPSLHKQTKLRSPDPKLHFTSQTSFSTQTGKQTNEQTSPSKQTNKRQTNKQAKELAPNHNTKPPQAHGQTIKRNNI